MNDYSETPTNWHNERSFGFSNFASMPAQQNDT
jgi:hypothetical protein